MSRNYFKATTYEPSPSAKGRDMPVDVFVFFDGASALEAAVAYSRARIMERDGAYVSVWRRSPGVPLGVPVVGEGIGETVRVERGKRAAA